MNAPAQKLAVATTKRKTIVSLLEDKDTIKKFGAVLSGLITPDKMLRLCYSALRKTPRLMECDPNTVFGAMMTAASLDLEPNTVLQQAFLIPYAKNTPKKDDNGQIMKDPRNGKWLWDKVYECNFQIGYRGFIDLAYRSPRLVKLKAEAIHEKDFFDHSEGSESFLKFRKALSDRGPMIGAFCYLKARSELGAEADISTILPLDELHKIRSRSETYRSLTKAVGAAENDKDRAKAENSLKDTPWVMWEDDMAAKSAIKKSIKQFPLSRKIAIAAQIDNASDAGVLDMSSMADADFAKSVGEGENEPTMIEHQPEEQMEMVKASTRETEKITVQEVKEQKAEAQVDEETGEVSEVEQKKPAKQVKFKE